MQVAVFHPGTQHSRQTALALQDLGRLAFLATSLFHDPDRPGPLGRTMARYAVPGLDPALVRRHGLAEWGERVAARAGMTGLARHLDAWGNAQFGRWVAGQVAGLPAPVALWGFSGSARTAFEDPRLATLPRLLDRTASDYRYCNRQFAAIRESHPGWLGTADPSFTAAQIASDEAEYAAATRILCASPFAAATIRAESAVADVGEKIDILPYGYNQRLFGNVPSPQPRPDAEPVRFLFVGHVAANKGIQHLLPALAQFPASQARLTVVGAVHVPEATLAPYRDRVEWRGAVPQDELPAIMQAHDCLVLPSHFEGSAVTLLEALASGLAVIATPQAGLGPTQASGIVVATPDAALVEEAMLTLIDDRERLLAMRRAAQIDAQAHSFTAYRDGIAALLRRWGL